MNDYKIGLNDCKRLQIEHNNEIDTLKMFPLLVLSNDDGWLV